MTPTIRFRDGADELLKQEFGLANDKEIAAHIGVDPGQYNRVKNGKSSPGPYFQACVLIALQAVDLDLDFYNVFEVVPNESAA